MESFCQIETVWQASAVSISLRRQDKKFFIFDDEADHDHLAIKTSFLKKKKKKKKKKWCFKVKLCCLLGLVSSVYVNENL